MFNVPSIIGVSMRAFHGSDQLKDKYLARVMNHAKADQLVKGRYWEFGKGCAVGCTVHSSNHIDYETELGIPAELARIEDRLFERLPNDQAQQWPFRFLAAIRPGADLSKVGPRFALWALDTELAAAMPKVVEETLQAVRVQVNRAASGLAVPAWSVAAVRTRMALTRHSTGSNTYLIANQALNGITGEVGAYASLVGNLRVAIPTQATRLLGLLASA